MSAYLTDDLWLECAKSANAATARLTAGLKKIENTAFLHEPEANIIFAGWPRAAHKRLHEAGAQYYVIEGELEGDDAEEILTARLVCDWSVSDENVDTFLSLVRG
jgi:threonine aldolase